jgi:hypothetical protein
MAHPQGPERGGLRGRRAERRGGVGVVLDARPRPGRDGPVVLRRALEGDGGPRRNLQVAGADGLGDAAHADVDLAVVLEPLVVRHGEAQREAAAVLDAADEQRGGLRGVLEVGSVFGGGIDDLPEVAHDVPVVVGVPLEHGRLARDDALVLGAEGDGRSLDGHDRARAGACEPEVVGHRQAQRVEEGGVAGSRQVGLERRRRGGGGGGGRRGAGRGALDLPQVPGDPPVIGPAALQHARLARRGVKVLRALRLGGEVHRLLDDGVARSVEDGPGALEIALRAAGCEREGQRNGDNKADDFHGSPHLGGSMRKDSGLRPPIHPGWLRCSSVAYVFKYAPSSRLALRAPRRPRCVAVCMHRTTCPGPLPRSRFKHKYSTFCR